MSMPADTFVNRDYIQELKCNLKDYYGLDIDDGELGQVVLMVFRTLYQMASVKRVTLRGLCTVALTASRSRMAKDSGAVPERKLKVRIPVKIQTMLAQGLSFLNLVDEEEELKKAARKRGRRKGIRNGQGKKRKGKAQATISQDEFQDYI